ncbi:MAG: aminoacetone oxidase family FAD-binding enzyme [Lachnospiraceae bacterium]|nr:aminoacetone oxidase family FAD-binding enzyme [Lachnospiraceae bacterium]
MKVCVVGGGPAGMAAAISAAENGHLVTLLEHGRRVGKKLLLTGNGKCNLSNTDQDLCHYHGDPSFIQSVFDLVSYEDVISFLTGIGIFTRNKNGYLYPYSEQASAVLDDLRFALRNLKVNTLCETQIEELAPAGKGSGFFVRWKDMVSAESHAEIFDRVILAAGSKAAPATGSDGSGYRLAEALGHPVRRPLPALTYIKTDRFYCKQLAGLRFAAGVSLMIGDERKAFETGEVQFTKEGISGIPVFQLSFLVSRALSEKSRRRLCVLLDLTPSLAKEALVSYLNTRLSQAGDKTAEELLIGFMPKQLAGVLLKLAGIPFTTPCTALSEKALYELAAWIKALPFPATGTGGFDKAQTCTGGVITDSLFPTLESKLTPGLYFAGEILDVNGDCGGYNLTWAFASGILCGKLLTSALERSPGGRT